jgi:acyl dehydratase
MYFEDFKINEAIKTRRRVVTGTDIDLFASMTGAVNPAFMSDAFAIEQGRPARLTPGPLLFSLMIGLCYQAGTFDQVIAMAEVRNMKFKLAVHPGDMLSAIATPIEKRLTSKGDKGVVTLQHVLYKNGEKALTAEVVFLMKTKSA